jgi:transketolase
MPIRQALALGLGDINVRSSGGVLFAAADLYGSGSLNAAVPFVPNDREHLDSRALATGITEDGTSAFMAGVSTFGRHIGAEFSYGAFMTPMGWTAARLHAIGYDASGRRHGMPMMLICGHAGPATGEDGPTHADPASLSQWYSMQGMNGLMLDLTPGTNEDVWPLLVAALQRDPRPAVIGAFVTRPNFRVVDRAALGMADPLAGMSGIYRLAGPTEGRVPAAHVVLQGAGVLDELLQNGGEALTAIRRLDPGVDVHYVTSRLMFDALPRADRGRLWSPQMAVSAMGVTDFTADTMDGWITSSDGREATLSPHKGGHFLRSGIGSHVLKEGGLSADQIVDSVSRFVQQQATAALL